MNDTTAYEQIIGPLEPCMVRTVWRVTRNRQDAEDALQNALLAVWKRWDRVVRHRAPTALVLKMCVDAAYDVVRQRLRTKRKHGRSDSRVEPVDSAPDPQVELAAQEQSAEMLEAIQSLSRRQAAAVLLRVFEDLSYEEIAAALGCSAATARKHVERGRARLQIVLARYEPSRIARSST
ncbi:MAG TPA: RNA polymerase sigma factor [Planctomycetaceae bacterium]|jgi:RNA polymerase sigma factor (sigma-70 family)|nr:RNA polymerase sigma factor [Planctomycetaceae bacterium]